MTTQDDTGLSGEDADEAVFMRRYEADNKETEETEETVKESEETEETEETSEEETQEPQEADDAAVVRYKDGDEDKTVTVADLKRLASQEAELTRKTSEVAAVTDRAAKETEAAIALADAMIQRADKAWTDAGYDKVDMALAAQKLPEDAYKQLKTDMEALDEQRRFLRSEGKKLIDQVRTARLEEHRKAASTIDANMAKDIPGWTKESRSEVIAYAKANGFPEQLADNIVDVASLKMIRKAMLFDKGTKAIKDAKPTATSATTKTLKPGTQTTTQKPSVRKDALSRLRKSGSLDDAEAAFAARFGG